MKLLSAASTGLALAALVSTGLALGGCEKKKTPAPEPAASAPTDEAKSKKSDDDEESDEAPAVVAYPPGQGPPDAEAAPEREPRTGVCSMLDTGFDGENTRSTERLIVKIKEEKIAAAEYSYRGSYALDGKVENLSIPFRERKWIELEMPMTSGTKKFKIKVVSDVLESKGTAAQDKQGSCTWEKPPEDKKKKR